MDFVQHLVQFLVGQVLEAPQLPGGLQRSTVKIASNASQRGTAAKTTRTIGSKSGPMHGRRDAQSYKQKNTLI